MKPYEINRILCAHHWKTVYRGDVGRVYSTGEQVCMRCGERRHAERLAPAPTTLRPVRTTIHERVAATLRELAEQADAGEIIGVTVIAEHPADYYSITGSDTLSRLQSIGALFEAAMWRARR